MAHPKYTYQQVAKTIDHSLLKPEMTRDEVKEGCAIAKKYDVASNVSSLILKFHTINRLVNRQL